MRRVIAAAAVAVAALLAVGPTAARARFSVSPPSIDLSATRGRTTVGTFSVGLRGEGERRYVIDVEDVRHTPDGGYEYGPPTRSPFSASSWLAVSPRSFRGGPNRIQPIEYQVRVPAGAEPGDHVTSMTVKRIPAPARGGPSAIQAVSVRLTVRVPGRIRESVGLEALEAPAFAGGGPVAVSVRARNTGNVRLDFDKIHRGRLVIVDGDREKASVRFRGLLFPGEAQAFSLTWDSPPLLGRVDARATVKLPTRVASAMHEIWIVPWRQAGAILLVAVAAVLLLAGRRGRRRRASQARG